MALWALSRQGISSAVERGHALYAFHGAACHGTEGQGRVRGNATTIARGRRGTEMRGWAFFWATIAYGRRGTPMFPSLHGLDGIRQFSEAEIDELVAYLRSWHGREGKVRRGSA